MMAKTHCLLLALGCLTLLTGADWLRFRGPNGSGVAPDQQLPTRWSQEENMAWKVALPGRGSSCPIIVGDRLVLTCASGYRQDRLHVICYDAANGQQRWQRQFWATGRTMTHRSISPAAPTPVSDGKRIYAYFSSNDVACLDLQGNLLWFRGLMLEYPNASNSLGLASSPVVVDETLVIKIETDSQSLALGLNAATGETQWKRERPKLASWTSPVVVRGGLGGAANVVLQSGRGMTAYEALTGEEVWHYGSGCATIASSVAVGDVLYVPSNGLVALKPGASSEPEVLWQNNRLGPSTPTPLVYRGQIYTIGGSILKCADAKTGKLLWQARLKGRRFSASPVASGGYIYTFNEDGLGQVVEASTERGRVVGSGDLGEVVLCSPAIAHGALFVRSDRHLWKIAQTTSP